MLCVCVCVKSWVSSPILKFDRCEKLCVAYANLHFTSHCHKACTAVPCNSNVCVCVCFFFSPFAISSIMSVEKRTGKDRFRFFANVCMKCICIRIFLSLFRLQNMIFFCWYPTTVPLLSFSLVRPFRHRCCCFFLTNG